MGMGYNDPTLVKGDLLASIKANIKLDNIKNENSEKIQKGVSYDFIVAAEILLGMEDDKDSFTYSKEHRNRSFFGLGATAGISHVSQSEFLENINKELVELKDKSTIVTIGPSVSYYKELAPNLYLKPSLDFGVGFGSSSTQSLGYNDDMTDEVAVTTEYKDFILGLSLNIGFNYWLSERIAMSISYGSLHFGTSTQTSKEDSNVKWKTNTSGIDLSPSTIHAGIILKL
jgi:hypothetical protein